MPTEEKKSNWFVKTKKWLTSLSFRTGMIVLGVCLFCYIMSALQFILPISAAAKGILFTVFFGLAKATQYIGLIIIGKTGIERIKSWRNRRKNGEIH